MAEVALAIQTMGPTLQSGLDPVYHLVPNGETNTFDPSEKVFLHIKNTGAASCTVTVPTPKTVSAGTGDFAIGDAKAIITAASERMLGPLPANLFARPADGKGSVTYSSYDNIRVAAISL